jgi:hypothetical protein
VHVRFGSVRFGSVRFLVAAAVLLYPSSALAVGPGLSPSLHSDGTRVVVIDGKSESLRVYVNDSASCDWLAPFDNYWTNGHYVATAAGGWTGSNAVVELVTINFWADALSSVSISGSGGGAGNSTSSSMLADPTTGKNTTSRIEGFYYGVHAHALLSILQMGWDAVVRFRIHGKLVTVNSSDSKIC